MEEVPEVLNIRWILDNQRLLPLCPLSVNMMRHMFNRTVFLILLAPSISCDPSASIENEVSPIVGGQLHSEHPEVGQIKGGGSGCTATLIGRKTVLTAAHCVDAYPATPVYFQPSGQFTSTESESVEIHPSWTSWNGDIAIVRLKEAVRGIVPARAAQSAPYIGESLTLVGFGHGASSDPADIKRIGYNKISELDTFLFGFRGSGGALTCPGDSGGPAFATREGVEWVIGVHSTGGGGDCANAKYPEYEGFSNDVRVDAYYQWLLEKSEGDLYQGEPIDMEPPSLSITYPEHYAEMPPSFTVKVDASDETQLARVELWVNGIKKSEAFSSPFTFSVGPLYQGTSHQIKALAYDAELNEAASEIKVRVAAAKAFGEACNEGYQCKSGLCAIAAGSAMTGNASNGFCSETCTASTGCPMGYSCLESQCQVADEDGGCSFSPQRPRWPANIVLLVVAVLFVVVRRKPRPRRTRPVAGDRSHPLNSRCDSSCQTLLV